MDTGGMSEEWNEIWLHCNFVNERHWAGSLLWAGWGAEFCSPYSDTLLWCNCDRPVSRREDRTQSSRAMRPLGTGTPTRCQLQSETLAWSLHNNAHSITNISWPCAPTMYPLCESLLSNVWITLHLVTRIKMSGVLLSRLQKSSV